MNYEMGGTILCKTVKEKDLGVTINANMRVSEQCRIAASKGNQIIGMIRRNITYKVKGLIVPLYKAIVRPHLEYCIQAWRPYLRKDIDMLEKVQRRTTKLITGLRDLSYDDRLKECGLTTLETRRLRGDQIEVFKILNDHENIDPNIFFKIKTGKITRGHDFTLVKGQNRLDFRKYSFSQRTVNEWNKLSADCVHSSSVNMFKNRIDNYLVRAGYTKAVFTLGPVLFRILAHRTRRVDLASGLHSHYKRLTRRERCAPTSPCTHCVCFVTVVTQLHVLNS